MNRIGRLVAALLALSPAVTSCPSSIPMIKQTLPIFLCCLLAAAAMAGEPYPVFQKDDVILFQGDSITDGGRARTGTDQNHIMGQDYAYIISA